MVELRNISEENFIDAFKNLKKITISTTKLTTKRVGASAFKGIHAKATVKCPKNLKSKYKKLLLQKGMKKTVKFS